MAIINNSVIGLLERTLDVSLYRQNVINANLSNIDTPGYIPHDVDFERALHEAANSEPMTMNRTQASHLGSQPLPAAAHATFERPDGIAGPDGNTVDLDKQMARSSQNSILYQTATRVVSKKLAMLKYAATEGGS